MPATDKRLQQLWRITLLLSAVGVLLGLLLRYYLVNPQGFNFKYVLHAHSHTMLLGWLFNALLILLYQKYCSPIPPLHYWLFLGLQISVLGMLLTFPWQGYALFSITFSTLHIWISYVLLYKFWKQLKPPGLEVSLIRVGIIFHFLSTLGPYALGPIIANGLRGSDLYQQAIYFYLHFQYNGSFFFWLLALIVAKWKREGAAIQSGWFLFLMTAGSILGWSHSLEFSLDSWWVTFTGYLGAACQLLAGVMLFRVLDYAKVSRAGLLVISLLGIKWVLELLGSAPELADLVVSQRNWLIAWLHYIFIGVFTTFIWSQTAKATRYFYLFALLFFLSELSLLLSSTGFFPAFQQWPLLSFSIYAALVACWFRLIWERWRWPRVK